MMTFRARIWKDRDIGIMAAGIATIGIFLGVCIACTVLLIATAEAEEMRVICRPDSYVNVRESPGRTGREAGRLYLGDLVETDGKRSQGWIHITDVGTEAGDGWINADYLTADTLRIDETGATVSRNRVALRKAPDGKLIRWLKKGERLTVYAWSGLWAVTDRGWVMIEYLECDH